MRIAANDSGLAHGVVKSLGAQADDMAERIVRKLQKVRNAEQFMVAVSQHFGDRIIGATVTKKLIGSRARIACIAFEPLLSGDFALLRIVFTNKHPRVVVEQAAVILEKHAVARFLHRTQGTADVSAAVGALAPYVARLLVTMRDRVEGSTCAVSGPSGELRARYERGALRIKTWIGAERATPTLEVRMAA